MLLDYFYEFGLLLSPSGLKNKFLLEGHPHDLFCLALNPPLPWADMAKTS